MKKAFWGYDVKAVDDEIGKLEMQNYQLRQQIKHLENERKELDTRIRNISGILKANRSVKTAAAQENMSTRPPRTALNVKELSREKLELLLAYYAEGWKRSNEQVIHLLAQVAASRERAKDALLQSANDILQDFDGIGAAVNAVKPGKVEFLTMENPAVEASQMPKESPVIRKKPHLDHLAFDMADGVQTF